MIITTFFVYLDKKFNPVKFISTEFHKYISHCIVVFKNNLSFNGIRIAAVVR